MKILYAEGKLHNAGQQILVTAVGVNKEYLSLKQKQFRMTFPDVDNIIDKVYDSCNYAVLAAPGSQEPPKLGDVIWVETSGGKIIANCVIYDASHHLNIQAIEACIKSVRDKAETIEQPVIAMDLLETDRNGQATLEDWSDIVSTIENILEDMQVIVYIPEKNDLIYVIEHLPGGKNFRKIYATPSIRFRQISEN